MVIIDILPDHPPITSPLSTLHERKRSHFRTGTDAPISVGKGWRQHLPDKGEFCFAVAIGEETVVANALESDRQHMQGKAANKFVRGKLNLCDTPLVTIVLPGEGHVLVGCCDETMIGGGETTRVASGVTQDLLRPGKRAFAVDHPVGKAERRQVVAKALESARC